VLSVCFEGVPIEALHDRRLYARYEPFSRGYSDRGSWMTGSDHPSQSRRVSSLRPDFLVLKNWGGHIGAHWHEFPRLFLLNSSYENSWKYVPQVPQVPPAPFPVDLFGLSCCNSSEGFSLNSSEGFSLNFSEGFSLIPTKKRIPRTFLEVTSCS